jgi:hypothetical protein
MFIHEEKQNVEAAKLRGQRVVNHRQLLKRRYLLLTLLHPSFLLSIDLTSVSGTKRYASNQPLHYACHLTANARNFNLRNVMPSPTKTGRAPEFCEDREKAKCNHRMYAFIGTCKFCNKRLTGTDLAPFYVAVPFIILGYIVRTWVL